MGDPADLESRLRELERAVLDAKGEFAWNALMHNLRAAARIGAEVEREACALVVEARKPTAAAIGFMAETEQLAWKLDEATEAIRARGAKP